MGDAAVETLGRWSAEFGLGEIEASYRVWARATASARIGGPPGLRACRAASFRACLGKTLALSPHHRPTEQPPLLPVAPLSIRRGKYPARTLNVHAWRIAIRCDRLKPASVRR